MLHPARRAARTGRWTPARRRARRGPLEPEQPHRVEQHRQRAESGGRCTPASGACSYQSATGRTAARARPVRTMPTSVDAEGEERMFWRMMRTVSRDSRHAAAAAGASGSPIRTMSPASAATSVPVPPMARPTSARARAGASLMPSPTKATRQPPCRRSARVVRERARRPRRSSPLVDGWPEAGRATNSAFCAGSSSRVDLGQPSCSATAFATRRAVAGEQGDAARCPGRAARPARRPPRAAPVAGADRAEHGAVARDQQRRLARGVELVQPRGRLGRDGDALLFQQPAGADDDRARPDRAVTPAPGWAWNSLDASQWQVARSRPRPGSAGQRMLAALLRRGRGAAESSVVTPSGSTSPSSSCPR